jgi:hypothetical protein
MAEASAVEVLGALTLAGMLGAAGQAVRAIGGLKKMMDQARAAGVAPFDPFVPSRFLVSLVVGFVAGMVAALSLGLSKLIPVNFDNTELLLGLAAAGYGGTDFLEAFARRLDSGTPQQQVKLVSPPPAPQTTAPAPASTVGGHVSRVPPRRSGKARAG